MNIGDYVYIYLFDLEKSLINMKQLRNDRFGRILNKSIVHNNNGNDLIVYQIELLQNNKIIEYRTDNINTSMISINELVEIIGRAEVSSDKRSALLEQVNNAIRG